MVEQPLTMLGGLEEEKVVRVPAFLAHRITATEREGGSGIVLMPVAGDYTNVVIWLHGLGDTPDAWAQRMPSLGLSRTKFILPEARLRPVSMYHRRNLHAWCDVVAMDPDAPEDKIGLEESALRLIRLVQAEIDNGVAPDRIVLAGFSQGASLALHVALRLPVAVGGCVVVSGWLPLRQEYPAALSAAAAATPILQVHGANDPAVPVRFGQATHSVLTMLFAQAQAAGTSPPRLHLVEGLGHAFDDNALAAVRAFLVARWGHWGSGAASGSRSELLL